ncbi:MAG: hypothetical protein ABIH03_08410 [Pseudomonadota bacterium]
MLCELKRERVAIAGQVVEYLRGEIEGHASVAWIENQGQFWHERQDAYLENSRCAPSGPIDSHTTNVSSYFEADT